jgi:hypothetical protein
MAELPYFDPVEFTGGNVELPGRGKKEKGPEWKFSPV